MPRVLVTAGPTREHLDDVRFLSNGSTGRMGLGVAAAAHAIGCDVTLVCGPTHLPMPGGIQVVPVVSADDMLAACQQAFSRTDILFAVAAVADHRPAHRHAGKPPREQGPYALELVPNPDIVATLAQAKGSRVVVGFSLDASGVDPARQRARALAKLARKGLDLIVVNDATALAAEQSSVVVLDGGGFCHALPPQSKVDTARWLVDLAVRRWSTGQKVPT